MSNLARVLQGDCLDRLREVSCETVDMVLTDPPYSSGGMFRSDRARPTSAKYLGNKNLPDFVGDSLDQRSWYRWTVEWLSECRRAMKVGGYCLSFIDWRQLPTLTDCFQAAGLTWRGVIPWDKLNARTGHNGLFNNRCEYVVWGTKGACAKRPNGSKALHGYVQCPTVYHARKRHQTEKPQQVLEHLMQPIEPGGLILDPFCGSGSTGEAALRLGHDFIGIELSEAYFQVARERLAA